MAFSKIINMFKAMIPSFVYFFITFQLLAITKALILREYSIDVVSFSNATIMALILAKVVLIVDEIEYVKFSNTKPLIYEVLWKTFIYILVTLLFSYIEHLIHFWKSPHSFSEANTLMFDEINLAHYMATQLWLIASIFLFCSLRALINHFGKQEVKQVFFKFRN
ncbi:hypothetical protein [uncultured Algibacter sp.]|uniref:hypothetical protein n=1 Tax=uncultured Algibacter sp. TaxID=298659 RepID=UPI0026094662|nr:hypothetical protein [uncultured Algibacter sp.]